MPISGDIYAPLAGRRRAEGLATLGDFFGLYQQAKAGREASEDRKEAREIQKQDRQLRQQEIGLRTQTIQAQATKLRTDEEKIAKTRELMQQHTTPEGIDFEGVLEGLYAIDPDAAMELDKHLDERAKAKREATKAELDARRAQLDSDAKDQASYLERFAIAKTPEQWADVWADASENKMLRVLKGTGLSGEFTPEGPAMAADLVLGVKGRSEAAVKAQVQANTEADDKRADATAAEIRRHNLAMEQKGGSGAALTPYAESNILNRLTTQWATASKSAVELDRQVQLMEAGLAAARKGDMAQGSQAILVTFQKILDPTSVVRESEYMRSASGLSLLTRIEGAYEQLAKGGARVPISELEKFADLARSMSKAQATYRAAQKDRIGKAADRYNIPRELIFEDFALPGAVAAPGQAGAPGANPFRK